MNAGEGRVSSFYCFIQYVCTVLGGGGGSERLYCTVPINGDKYHRVGPLVNSFVFPTAAFQVYMIQRQKGDREIGPTISMKLPPKESKPDAGESEQVHTEVALHEHVDVRPEAGAGAVERNESSPGRGAGSPVPVADIGILDVMCGCFCGVLKAVR